MKKVTTVTRAVSLLEKMYRCFNARCFDGRLHDCVITVERMRGAYGCYWVHPQYYVQGDCTHWKIALNPVHFSKPVEFVAAVLLHEMCHHAAALDGVQDTSRGGSYHNKQFKAYCDKTGLLNCDHHDKYGWTLTEPNDSMIELCISEEWPEFEISERDFLFGFGKPSDSPKSSDDTPKTKSNSIKHVCPVCGAIARTTKDIPLICGTCRVDMVK